MLSSSNTKRYVDAERAAGPIYFALTSLVALLWLILPLEGTPGPDAIILSVLAWATLCLAMCFIDLLLSSVWRQRLVSLRWIVAAYLPLVVVVLDGLHFVFFQKHFDALSVSTALIAANSDEIHLDTGWYLSLVFMTAVWTLAGILLLQFLRRLPKALLSASPFRSFLTVMVVAVLLLTVRFVKVENAAEAAPYLPQFLTWDWLAGSAASRGESQPERIGEFSIFTEREQFRRLDEARRALLESPVTAKRTPSILIVHVEGLRSDMFTPERMPRLFAEGERCAALKRCLTPRHHYSTGNNTGTGVFGLLNGMNGFYYHIFRRQFSHSIPIQILKRLGYRFSFYSETDWNYDDQVPLYFLRDADYLYHARNQPKDDLWQKETAMLDRYLEELSGSHGPRIDYLGWIATHYNYFYPKSFEKNVPVLSGGFQIDSNNFSHLRKDAQAIKNRYLNSILYLDDRMGYLMERLRSSGRLEDTIVVIAGDHGEEFWEHGRFGHTFGLSNEQTAVTFFVHFPDTVESRYQFSSHEDLMPTLFDFMGVAIDAPRFMTGKSLLRHDPARDWVLVSMGILMFQVQYEHMIVGNGMKVRFENAGPPRALSVHDLEDNLIAPVDPSAVNELLNRALNSKVLLVGRDDFATPESKEAH